MTRDSGGLGVLQEERTGARMRYIHHELRLGVRGCRVGLTAIRRSLQESCGVLGGVFGQEGSRESEECCLVEKEALLTPRPMTRETPVLEGGRVLLEWRWVGVKILGPPQELPIK